MFFGTIGMRKVKHIYNGPTGSTVVSFWRWLLLHLVNSAAIPAGFAKAIRPMPVPGYHGAVVVRAQCRGFS